MSSDTQISKTSIKRLAYVAGVPYISSPAIDLTLKLIDAYIDEVSRNGRVMMEYLGTKTIQSSLLQEMTKNQNTVFLKSAVPDMFDTDRAKACRPISVKPPSKTGSDARLKYILSKIKVAQNEWGKCYIIPRQTIVKKLKESLDGEYRISKEALQNLSVILETFVVNMLQGARLISEHAQRLKLSESDISVSMIVKDMPLSTSSFK